MKGVAAAAIFATLLSSVVVAAAFLLVSKGEGPPWYTGASQVVVGPTPTPRVVSSVPDPSEPVEFRWTIRPMDEGGGWRVILQGGTIHAIVAAVRLVDSAGQVVATAPAVPILEPDPCMGTSGLMQARLDLPAEGPVVTPDQWPSNLRLEASVGPTWRATALTYVGC